MVGKAAVDAGLADRVGAYEAVLAEMQQQRRNKRYGMTSAVASTTAQEDSMELTSVFRSFFRAAKEEGIPIEASEETPVAAPAPSPVPATQEPDSALKAENDRLRAENEQLKAEREREAAVLTAERDARAKAEAEAQQSRFQALIANSGTPWVGEVKGHLTVLLALGEGSEAFTAYVACQNAVAAQLSTSKLLEEVGSDSPGTSAGSDGERFIALVNQHAKGHKIDLKDAMSAVAGEHPALYQAYMGQAQKVGRAK
jgi:type IV secretory pathway VirB10-like protein